MNFNPRSNTPFLGSGAVLPFWYPGSLCRLREDLAGKCLTRYLTKYLRFSLIACAPLINTQLKWKLFLFPPLLFINRKRDQFWTLRLFTMKEKYVLGQRNTVLRKYLRYQKDVLRWEQLGWSQDTSDLGWTQQKTIVLPISWVYGDYTTFFNLAKEVLMWNRLPIWTRVQSRKFDKKTENYERREGINFAVNFAKSLRISQGLPSGEQPVLGSPDNCLQELEVFAVVIAPASPIIITIYYYYCYYYDFNFSKLLWETENRIENAYTYKTFKYFKTFINTNIVKYFSVFTSCSEGAKHCKVFPAT